jgi:taurine dioxygenase
VAGSLTVVPMPGPFGATVDGVDLSEPLDDDSMLRLAGALYEHRILVVRGQAGLGAGDYARFGRQWGEPISFFDPTARGTDHPELIRITNSPQTPERLRDGAMHWHADSSYEAVPAAVTMLMAAEVPAAGNQTLFADCIAAYEALGEDLQRRICGLEVIHDPRGGKVNFESERRGHGTPNSLPIVTHPLSRRHPVTGRRTLYGFSGTAAGIVGMGESEALELLVRLKRHALQPRFRQEARAEVGSILIWDNFAVVHSATATAYSDEDGQRRLLYRISTRGIPRVCRARATAAAGPVD